MLDRCAAHPEPVILALPGVRGCGGALQGDDQAAVEGPDAGQCRALAAEYARAKLRNAETGFYIWVEPPEAGQ